MPSLVGVQKWRNAPSPQLRERLLEHVSYQGVQGSLLNFEGHDFAVEDECRDTATFEGAPPDDNLVRIANIVDRSNLPTGEPLTILMRQHLKLEVRSVGTAFLLEAGNSVQPECLTQVRIFPGHGPAPREQLRAASSSQKALNDLALELCFVLPHGSA